MTKFLERPKCNCFKPDRNGLGDQMTSSVAGMVLDSLRTALVLHGVCPEAYFITAVKATAMMVDYLAYSKCDRNLELSDKLRVEWAKALPEAIAHIIKEVDDELASSERKPH